MCLRSVRLMWRRKEGADSQAQSGLAAGRRAVVHQLDAAEAVSAVARGLGASGTTAVVPITGPNAKQVLLGAIDVHTAHRVVLVRRQAGQLDAQVFLAKLRRRYRRAGRIWLLAARGGAHTAGKTLALAERLRIRQLWPPKQGVELGPMDQLWRDLKRLVAANRQADFIDALAAEAVQ